MLLPSALVLFGPFCSSNMKLINPRLLLALPLLRPFTIPKDIIRARRRILTPDD